MNLDPSMDKAATGLFTMEGVRLRGLVGAVPATAVPNASFHQAFSPEEIGEIAKMIGVETRYWSAPGQTSGDLCRAAADTLLKRLAWAPDSVDALLFVSQTPDYPLPATACILQHRLGLSTNTAAFDVGLGCSGYVYGLWLASSLIGAGCRRVLLLAGDTSSRFLDKADSGTALVFGDAGSATALEADITADRTVYAMGTDGGGKKSLIIPKGLRTSASAEEEASDRLFMDGFQVFSFTLNAVPPLVREALSAAGRTVDDVDIFALHQANAFMLKHIAKKLKVSMDKMPINIDRFGNTSSASIPLLLASDLRDIVTTRTTRLVMAGFGAGFSWGACVTDLEPMACADLIFV